MTRTATAPHAPPQPLPDRQGLATLLSRRWQLDTAAPGPHTDERAPRPAVAASTWSHHRSAAEHIASALTPPDIAADTRGRLDHDLVTPSRSALHPGFVRSLDALGYTLHDICNSPGLTTQPTPRDLAVLTSLLTTMFDHCGFTRDLARLEIASALRNHLFDSPLPWVRVATATCYQGVAAFGSSSPRDQRPTVGRSLTTNPETSLGVSLAQEAAIHRGWHTALTRVSAEDWELLDARLRRGRVEPQFFVALAATHT